MSEKPKIQPYHQHVLLLLSVGLVAIGFLWVTVWTMQQSNKIHSPLTASKITPTPLISASLSVDTPHIDDHVPQDFIVTGTTKSDKVGIRLLEKYSGRVITEVRAMSGATQPGQTGKFGAELNITDDSIRSEAPLILEIFETDGGNQELNKITIPLTFTPIGG